MLLYVFYFAQPEQLQRVDQHIANSRNSCLPTTINPVQLKKSQKTFYIKPTQKRCNNWHMISFILFGSGKSGNKLADPRKEVASYMGVQYQLDQCIVAAIWVHEDDAEICLGYSVFYCSLFANSQKILLSRWLFEQLKNHILSYLTGATQHKDTGIY